MLKEFCRSRETHLTVTKPDNASVRSHVPLTESADAASRVAVNLTHRDSQALGRTGRSRAGPAGPFDPAGLGRPGRLLSFQLVKGESEETIRVWYGMQSNLNGA